jgi:hypothetical protein
MEDANNILNPAESFQVHFKIRVTIDDNSRCFSRIGPSAHMGLKAALIDIQDQV